MAKITRGMFSSKHHDYSTPPWLFDLLSEVVDGFDLDPCASPLTAKCDRYYTVEDDGLAQNWADPPGTKAYVNSPYGQEIKHWAAKCLHDYRAGAEVVQLAAARTETAWFQGHAPFTSAIWLPNKRIQFLQPCRICGTLTKGRYSITGDKGDSEPLCKYHKPPDKPSRNAPGFPSVVLFYLRMSADLDILRPHGIVIESATGYKEQQAWANMITTS